MAQKRKAGKNHFVFKPYPLIGKIILEDDSGIGWETRKTRKSRDCRNQEGRGDRKLEKRNTGVH